MQGVPPDGRIWFSVWYRNVRVGTHQTLFSPSATGMMVVTDAEYTIEPGSAEVQAYRQHVEEHWVGGQFTHLAAHTDANGKHNTCTATRVHGVLQVSGSGSGTYHAPPGTIAATHWNASETQAPVINPDDGVLMRFSVTQDNTIPPGGSHPAHHFGLTGFATLDLWYGAGQAWVGLRAVTKDGSVLEYRRH